MKLTNLRISEMRQITITKSQFLKGDYSMENYKQEANPNATNSELDAKVVIKSNNEEKDITEKDNSPYDQIPSRF